MRMSMIRVSSRILASKNPSSIQRVLQTPRRDTIPPRVPLQEWRRRFRQGPEIVKRKNPCCFIIHLHRRKQSPGSSTRGIPVADVMSHAACVEVKRINLSRLFCLEPPRHFRLRRRRRRRRRSDDLCLKPTCESRSCHSRPGPLYSRPNSRDCLRERSETRPSVPCSWPRCPSTGPPCRSG